MPFSNTQIDISTIPSSGTIDYKGLQKDYLTASMIRSFCIWAVIVLVVAGTIQMNKDDLEFSQELGPYLKYIYGVLATLALLSIASTYFGFFKKGYAVREKDISYKQGLFWKSKTLIPFNRIQHSEVKQGPFERMFSLASLRVFTAGGSASDLSIKGLKLEEANHLKQFIIKKTSDDEEE